MQNMNNDEVLQETRDFVYKEASGDGSAHDWWHVVRVVNNAKTIAATEGGDLFTVELGALLHDIADWKFHDGDVTLGPKMARDWLEKQGVDKTVIEKVVEIVAHISFRGGSNEHVMQTLEGEVVQDADRLDSLGAIGIARTFAFGGSRNREMYDPNIPPRKYKDFEDYKAKIEGTPTINHFYEKLLLVKDKMNTTTGKELAEDRHKYLEQFLEEFYAEWDGEK
jgi:uncharacterized protein